jgi:hypothetical protein
MIHSFSIEILKKINYIDNYFKLKNNSNKNYTISKTVRREEINKIFKELGYSHKHFSGGYYEIQKTYENHTFICQFHITKNIPLQYIYIEKDGVLLKSSPSLVSWCLHQIPYDASMINKQFGINNYEEMKQYLKGLMDIFEEYVQAYIEEIDAGRAPND